MVGIINWNAVLFYKVCIQDYNNKYYIPCYRIFECVGGRLWIRDLKYKYFSVSKFKLK